MSEFDQLKAVIDADPRVLQLARTRPTGIVSATELQQLGYPVEGDWIYHSPNNAYRDSKSFHNSASGLVDPSNWMSKTVNIAGPSVLGLGAGLALAGPSAASGSIPSTAVQPGGVTGGILPGTEAGLSAIPSTAVQAGGVTGGILPGTEAGLAASAPSASTSLLSQWLVPAIQAGAGFGGALIQKRASDNAVKAQTEAADKALELTKQQYEQDRADYAPYRNLGAFSLGQLGHLVGMPENYDFGSKQFWGTIGDALSGPLRGAQPAITPSASPWVASSTAPPIPQAAPQSDPRALPEFQSLRDLGARQQTSSSFVRMRAPNGEEEDVHPSEVPIFAQHGAVRVS